ncbi:four helix bundle protein [Algoriphagus litoralis]|uniref:four helix bundle protein n=1 Tax=Algoriphagus litoralis TaxID=2202829 RepID=UPI000DBA3464|nr:four helix bundle protein [Algoriphagus litoralis]
MNPNIQDRTFHFAEKILDAYFLLREGNHFRLADQLVGAGTSIGANVEEAQAAHSKADFISKMVIANKEARESRYWLRLLDRKKLLEDYSDMNFLKSEIEEIILVINAIIKKSRQNLNSL